MYGDAIFEPTHSLAFGHKPNRLREKMEISNSLCPFKAIWLNTSPITLPNLNPCPEKPQAKMTWLFSG